LRKNTRQLFQFYTDVFRARKVAFHQLPWPYKHHVSVLHNLFKDVLKAQGQKVTFEEVVKYSNGLSQEDMTNMAKVHVLTLKAAMPAVTTATTATPHVPVVQEISA
jgi:hypothetical protein